MNHKSVITLFALMATGLGSLMSYAQDEPKKNQGYIVWEDHVVPHKISSYEEATKLQMANYAEHEFPKGVSVFSTDDYRYYWVVSVDHFADIDTLYKQFNKLYKNSGEGVYDKIEAAFDGTYEYTRSWTCLWHRDLSYIPETNEEETGGAGDFRYWGFCYVKQGKGEEMREAFRKWVELYESKNISEGFGFYQGDLGTDMPFMFWSISAKNATEYYTNSEKIMEALGEEGSELWKETEALLRGFEPVTGFYRKDLSYITSQE
jgi:hypothetical protein